MARKKAPCDMCDCGFDGFARIESMGSENLIMEIYPGHGITASAILYNPATEETYEAKINIPMDFCPCCGKRWAM